MERTASVVRRPAGSPWLSIALVSMSALAYEILLMRLFSIIQWHHFAYMVISLALLGYGASGTFIALFHRRLLLHYCPVYIAMLVLFGVSAALAFMMSQAVPFNIEELLWDADQLLRIIGVYCLLAVPFFFAATAIGLTLSRHGQSMARIYAADLIGAGLGALLIIALLYIVFPQTALMLVNGLGLVAAMIACFELLPFRSAAKLAGVFAVLILAMQSLQSNSLSLRMSPYKALSQALDVRGSRIVDSRSSPLGLLHVVRNDRIPFRQAPGMSLKSIAGIPDQLGVFIDADDMTPITRYRRSDTMTHLQQTTSASPYHLKSVDHALVLGAGGGADVLQALSHEVPRVTAVELDGNIIDLVRNRYANYAGHVYNRDAVRVVQAEARGFIVADDTEYDLITLSMLDSYSASSAGLYALSESYLYTLEALQACMQRLKDTGIIAINRWLRLPPRDTLKLFNTAILALQNQGITRPERHLIALRSLQTTTLLISRSAFTPEQLAAVEAFSQRYAFDPIYYWNMSETSANRFNLLSQPFFYQGARALLSQGREAFIDEYKFDIRPATDDRPFFFHYFKWSTLTEIFRLMGEGGMPLIEWGYLVLVATLVQAVITSLVLILLPLIFKQSKADERPSARLRIHGLTYFLALGLGFMFIEIAFIQKFILFLYHPSFAIAVVLACFLVFAGMGSLWSHRYILAGTHYPGLMKAIGVIVLISLGYLLILESLFGNLIDLSTAARVMISIILIAPLAFAMGMPFALGLSRIDQIHKAMVPWAWGVNGCASVISAVLASLLAIHAGFNWVIVFAVLFYMIALLSAKRWI